MFDTKFKQALFDCMTQEYDLLLSDEDDYKYEFSKKFERKMKKLISRRNKSYYHIINTSFKRVACIALAILIASITTVMSVDALREKIAGFFITRLKKYSIVQSENINEKNYDKIIEDICNVTYGLDGYKICDISENNKYISISYAKEKYNVYFNQCLSEELNEWANTEGVEIQKIYINGNEALYFKDIIGFHNYIWKDGKYGFHLMTDGTTKEESLKMAESVKITGDYKLKEIEPQMNYKITYDLSKYELVDYWVAYYEPYRKDNIDNGYVTYGKDGNIFDIMLSETRKESFTWFNLMQKYNNDNTRIFHTKINGKDAIFFLDYNYDYNFVWSNDEYVFELTVPFSFTKEEGIKLAESIKKSQS